MSETSRHSQPVRAILSVCAASVLLLAGCATNRQPEDQFAIEETQNVSAKSNSSQSSTELATFGAGCFWCVEACFQQLAGVLSVESGYAGGHVPNPTYLEVCSKTTGHAEVCQIKFDPSKIAYEELLEVFWKVHDPTTPNRQGPDVGPQYRSVIFYHNDQQRALADKYKSELNAAGAYENPVVTEISPFTNFYKAEEEHQNFYRLNPNHGYCRVMVRPKVDKVRAVFASKLKKGE